MSDRLKKIKERLSKATPGPWRLFRRPDGWYLDEVIDGNNSQLFEAWGKINETNGDANFVANSRADIEWLVAEVERLHECMKVLETAAESWRNDYDKMVSKYESKCGSIEET